MEPTRYKFAASIGAPADSEETRDRVQRMFRWMGAGDEDAASCIASSPEGVLAGGSAQSPAAATGPDGSLTIVAGGVYNAGELADRYGLDTSPFDGPDNVAAVAALLAGRGDQVVGELSGAFALVHRDRDGRVLVANDRYGFGPLHYHVHRDAGGREHLTAASHMGAIATAVAGLDFDLAGWGLYFYISHMISDRTIFDGVRFLGPGELLLWQDGRVQRRRYFDPYTLPTCTPADAPDVSTVADAMNAAVARRVETVGTGTVMLSGGLDSRWILASLLEQGHRPDLWHVRFDRGIDREESELLWRLVREVGLPCEQHDAATEHDHSELGLRVFRELDGLYPTFGLICTKLFGLLEAGGPPVWDGAALGTVAGGHNIATGRPIENLDLVQRFRLLREPMVRRVFNRDLADAMAAGADRIVNDEVARLPDEVGNWNKFILVNRQRRRIGPNCYQLYAGKRLCLAPGTDSDLLDLMLTMPASRLVHRGFYADLFRERYPYLYHLPAVSFHTRVNLAEPNPARVDKPTLADRLTPWLDRNGLGWLARGAVRWLRGDKAGRVDGMLRLLDAYPPDADTFDVDYLARGMRALRRGGRGSLRWIDPVQMAFTVQLWRLIFVQGRYDELAETVFPPDESI